MFLSIRTKKLIKVLHERTHKPTKEIIEDSIKIFAYLYGQDKENKEIIIRDEIGDSKLIFKDFL